jgi:putative tricarboxylic transport membrane protein
MDSADRATRLPLWQATGGVALLVAGVAILGVSWSYPTGGIVQMGPGYFPKAVGIGLVAMAVAVIISDLRGLGTPGEKHVHWRPLICLSASVLTFGLLVTRAGLVPATFTTLVLAMLADRRSRQVGILVYAGIGTLLAWLLFIPVLGLPISAFWR